MNKKQLTMATKLFEEADIDPLADALFIANILFEQRDLSMEDSLRLTTIYDRIFGYGIEG